MTNSKKEQNGCDDRICEIKAGKNEGAGDVAIAPELDVSEWLNTNEKNVKLADLKGKVVLVEVFQMLCPGCVIHSLPQAKRLHSMFRDSETLVILGLHSVFEHHDAMQKKSLQAFLSEFRYDFPVAIDQHKDGDKLPETMKKYALNGTPSLVIIDKNGKIREILFGQVNDLVLGIKLGKLLVE